MRKEKHKTILALKIGAAALGAFAVGATAIGAIAVGTAAVGSFKIGRSLIGKLKIGELSVGSLRLGKIGKKTWIIPEGYIPPSSSGPEPQMLSHETACILNPNKEEANVEITIYFSDKNPIGPYKLNISGERTMHIRFNNLNDPEPIPVGTDYSSIIKADVPVVVQHTRLDSRQAENALLSTIAYPAE